MQVQSLCCIVFVIIEVCIIQKSKTENSRITRINGMILGKFFNIKLLNLFSFTNLQLLLQLTAPKPPQLENSPRPLPIKLRDTSHCIIGHC